MVPLDLNLKAMPPKEVVICELHAAIPKCLRAIPSARGNCAAETLNSRCDAPNVLATKPAHDSILAERFPKLLPGD